MIGKAIMGTAKMYKANKSVPANVMPAKPMKPVLDPLQQRGEEVRMRKEAMFGKPDKRSGSAKAGLKPKKVPTVGFKVTKKNIGIADQAQRMSELFNKPGADAQRKILPGGVKGERKLPKYK